MWTLLTHNIGLALFAVWRNFIQGVEFRIFEFLQKNQKLSEEYILIYLKDNYIVVDQYTHTQKNL